MHPFVALMHSTLQNYQEFLHIREQLRRLPVRYQEVIALEYFEDKKISGISEILGKKDGTVESLLSRGMEKLRKML